MDHDDAPRGRVLTRREAIALLGMSGVMLMTGCLPAGQAKRGATSGGAASGSASSGASSGSASGGASSSSATAGGSSAASDLCVARPEQTEGPYFVDEMLNRSDLRTDPSDGSVSPGAPLALTLAVSQLVDGSCTPLAGGVVDVWHCDARGAYSDVQDPFFNTVGKKFLRGHQVTDAEGLARFVTVYPGWYPGRTVHIHFKIRSAPEVSPGFDFTSQLYFDDALTDRVHAESPYASKGQRDLRNDGDGIYRRGGSRLMLPMTPGEQGYASRFDVALQV